MDYKLLDADTRNEMLANTLLAQEQDHFSHTTNIERYKAMLAALPPGPWKDKVQHLHDEGVGRLTEVSSIITALTPQLPAKAILDAAMARVIAKRAK